MNGNEYDILILKDKLQHFLRSISIRNAYQTGKPTDTMICMNHIVTRSKLIQLFERQSYFARTSLITFQVILMKTVEQLMIRKNTKMQRMIHKTFMYRTFYRSKLNLISPIFKDCLDTVGLFSAVTTDIKRISLLQIVFERTGYQIKVFMKNRLYGGAESNAGIRCTGWLISKLHPTKIKGAHCKFTAVYQFTFQRDTTIFLSFLHGNSLWSQSLIMYYLNTLAQPKEITHSQNSFLWNKIKKRGCYLSGHSQIRNNSYSLLFLTGQLRLYFKCTDTFYFISEKVNTVRIFRGKRKDINNTAPNSILSGLVHIIYIFKTVTMQYVCDKSRIQLLANIQFQCFVTQFFA